MARVTATEDVFGAIAEPRRRTMLDVLARTGERPVAGLVADLGWPQPAVSKHLAVLLEVGLVQVRRDGRRRLYQVNGAKIKTIYDWTRLFEGYWTSQLQNIKQRAEARMKRTENKEKGL